MIIGYLLGGLLYNSYFFTVTLFCLTNLMKVRHRSKVVTWCLKNVFGLLCGAY